MAEPIASPSLPDPIPSMQTQRHYLQRRGNHGPRVFQFRERHKVVRNGEPSQAHQGP